MVVFFLGLETCFTYWHWLPGVAAQWKHWPVCDLVRSFFVNTLSCYGNGMFFNDSCSISCDEIFYIFFKTKIFLKKFINFLSFDEFSYIFFKKKNLFDKFINFLFLMKFSIFFSKNEKSFWKNPSICFFFDKIFYIFFKKNLKKIHQFSFFWWIFLHFFQKKIFLKKFTNLLFGIIQTKFWNFIRCSFFF